MELRWITLGLKLSHRIRPVSAILAPHVEHLWVVRGYLPARWRNMILPDGAMELMINLGDPQKLCARDNLAKHAIFRQSWISGERTTPIVIDEIGISNEVVTGEKASPYIDGLYAWDPQQRVIVFWYVDAKGSLTKGTVKMEDGKLVHQFQETESDGKTADYVARVTPHGNEAWDNEIFARKGNGLTPLVKVRYEVAQ